MVSWVPLLAVLLLATAHAVATAPAPRSGTGSGFVARCLQQLAKDGCDPTAGPQRCGECAQLHRGDLLNANCTEAYLLYYTLFAKSGQFCNWCLYCLAGAQGRLSPEQTCHGVLRAQGSACAWSQPIARLRAVVHWASGKLADKVQVDGVRPVHTMRWAATAAAPDQCVNCHRTGVRRLVGFAWAVVAGAAGYVRQARGRCCRA